MENKKSTFNARLKSYSAIAGTMVAAANTANAQVIYTDVSPDAVVATGGTYDLDLNNDGTVDYQFGLVHGTNNSFGLPVQYDLATLTPSTGNAIDTTTGGSATAHSTAEAINSSLIWADDAGAPYQLLGISLPSFGYQSGNFIGQTDKYVGLRFKIGAVDHYGWVRIDLNGTATSLTVKDYAYDGTAGTSILTGATATGINEQAAMLSNTVSVFSADKAIRVNMNNAKAEGVVVVTNTLGQEIAKMNITEAQMTIPVENANSGIYFVSVIQGSASITQKVIIR
jgi:hypothetical protein